MNINEVATAFNDRLLTLWTEFPTDNITFANEPFDPQGLSEWLRATIVETLSSQLTLGRVGNRNFQRDGLHVVNLYVPVADGGTARAGVLAQHYRDLFEGVTFSEICCFSTALTSQLPQDEWLQTTVQTSFQYKELK